MPKYSDFRDYEQWKDEMIEENNENRKLGINLYNEIPRGYTPEDKRYVDWMNRKFGKK